MLHANLDRQSLREHVALLRDQEHLRGMLAEQGLVAFVGDGANLPRRSGDSDLPLVSGVVPFASPDSLRTVFAVPSGRNVSGMGIPAGVTVIVGGGYHGKSTLLRSLERGVYPHIGGDGREWVITRNDAVTIRAEDERSISGVDISPFITNLPSGADTRRFSTPTASGSTSQAANLVEALEGGATTLLIDEDTSATNFMIRDERMRELVPADREPITPFVDRVRILFATHGVSTILVAGGSGAFFDTADHILAMDAYRPRDVTAEAHRIAGREGMPNDEVRGTFLNKIEPRVLGPRTLSSRDKEKPARARGRTLIKYGDDVIDLAAVSQLVDAAQTKAVAFALDRIAEAASGRERPLMELVTEVLHCVDTRGLDWLSPFSGHPGHLARPRQFEILAALNRYRGSG